MSCKRWEQAIALEEMDRPGLAEHMAVCENCRRLADEIAETLRTLGALGEPAIEPVSALVLARVAESRRPRLRRWAWPAAAAAAIALVLWGWPARRPAPPAPQQQAITTIHRTGAAADNHFPVPKHEVLASAHAQRHPAVAGTVRQVKIQTGDPNVVLIWVLD